jgi:UDP-N-acetylglucosamine acyltransferase
VHSRANFAGGVAVVQFCTVGRLSFVGGLGGVRQDMEPFLVHDRKGGDAAARAIGVNQIGLRRAGIAQDVIDRLRVAFHVIFGGRAEGPEHWQAEILRRDAQCPEVAELLEFIRLKRAGRLGRQQVPPVQPKAGSEDGEQDEQEGAR